MSNPLLWVLGTFVVIGAISAPIIYWGVSAQIAAEAACQKKGGFYYAPRGGPAVCLRPNAVIK